MNELVKMEKETITSLEVAELTGKRHDHVMRDIKRLISQGVGVPSFGESSYKDGQNRKQPMYKINKEGALILASGYNPKIRELIIKRWLELESHFTARFIGKRTRVNVTEAIQESGLNEKMHGFGYSTITKLIYKKADIEYKKCDNFRDTLTVEQIERVEKYEKIAEAFIELGYSYDELKDGLPQFESKELCKS